MLLTILEGGLEVFSTIETIWDDIDYVLGITDEDPQKQQPDPQLKLINERLKSIDTRLEKINNSLKDILDLLGFEETRALTKKYEESISDNYLSMLNLYEAHPKPTLDAWVTHVLDTNLGMSDCLAEISKHVEDESFIKKYVDHFIGNKYATSSLQVITNIQYAYFIGFEYKALLTLLNCIKYYNKLHPDDIQDPKKIANPWLKKIKYQASIPNSKFKQNYEQTCFFPALDENSENAYWGHMGLPDSTDEKSEKNGTVVTGINFGNDGANEFGYLQLTRSTIVQSEVPNPEFPSEPKYLAGQLINSHLSVRGNVKITIPKDESHLPFLVYTGPVMADPGYVIVGAGIENFFKPLSISGYPIDPVVMAFPKIQVQKLTVTRENGKTRYELDENDDPKWISSEDKYTEKDFVKNTAELTQGADAKTRAMLYSSGTIPTPELPLVGIQLQRTAQERQRSDKSIYYDQKWYVKVIPMNNLDAVPYSPLTQNEFFVRDINTTPSQTGKPKKIIVSGVIITSVGALLRLFVGAGMSFDLVLMAVGSIFVLYGFYQKTRSKS